jgi:hypothetical protein
MKGFLIKYFVPNLCLFCAKSAQKQGITDSTAKTGKTAETIDFTGLDGVLLGWQKDA